MPYFDKDGNEIEGLLTQDDLESKLAEERAAHETALAEAKAQADARVIDLEAERKLAQQKLQEYEAKNAGGDGDSDKDTNLANLRKKLEETTTALEDERKLNSERFSTLQNERIEQQIASIAGNDLELAKKIRFNYDNILTGMKGSTQDEISAKVASAYRLSTTGAEGPSALYSVIGGGNRGHVPVAPSGDGKKFTQAEVNAGKLFGVSDADRAKYGNDPRLKH